MNAERLVALEAALAELSGLYTSACNFTALVAAAENELLPQLTMLAARWRGLHRVGGIGQADIDRASREIVDLRADWQQRLDEVRRSAVFRNAREAFGRNDQRELKRLVPRIFAGVVPLSAPARLYAGIPVAARRRRPGSSPFLAVEACAGKIATIAEEGLRPAPSPGAEWWHVELPSIQLSGGFAEVEVPFAASFAGADIGAALFGSERELGYRVFAPRLHVTFSVEIAAGVDDEWWEAFEVPYESFREQLAAALNARGIAYSIAGGAGGAPER